MTLAAIALGAAALSLSVWSLIETARTRRIWRKIDALHDVAEAFAAHPDYQKWKP